MCVCVCVFLWNIGGLDGVDNMKERRAKIPMMTYRYLLGYGVTPHFPRVLSRDVRSLVTTRVHTYIHTSTRIYETGEKLDIIDHGLEIMILYKKNPFLLLLSLKHTSCPSPHLVCRH